jgi:hypothetical protein
MKKLVALALFALCAATLGACANLPPGQGAVANFGSSTPR